MEVKLDQHFLRSEGAIYQITKAVELKESDIVLEIGPGTGILTQEILKLNRGTLVSCELDQNLSNYLDLLKQKYTQFSYILGSALDLDFTQYTKIIGNIPYAITEPLYEKILDSQVKFAVFLHGKKFYDTITTKKQSKWYHLVNAFYTIEKITGVPGDLFEPPTKVSSTVVRLTLKADPTPYELLVREFFKKRERSVQNALVFSFVDSIGMTKTNVKSKLELPLELLSKQASTLSNTEFQLVLDQILKLLLLRN
jgi:16S rRNA (adenine1518-N6/adenine1519-N6)-dimethyltransferase